MVADQNGNLLFEFERRTQKLMNWVPILASAGQEPLGGACELFAKLVFPVGLFALAERLAPGRPSSAAIREPYTEHRQRQIWRRSIAGSAGSHSTRDRERLGYSPDNLPPESRVN